MAGPRATSPADDAPAAACATAACAQPRKARSVFMMTLLCAHCSLTLLVPLLAIALSAAGAYFGLPLTWIVPPFLIAGALLWLLWPSIQDSWTKLRDAAPQPPTLTETQG